MRGWLQLDGLVPGDGGRLARFKRKRPGKPPRSQRLSDDIEGWRNKARPKFWKHSIVEMFEHRNDPLYRVVRDSSFALDEDFKCVSTRLLPF